MLLTLSPPPPFSPKQNQNGVRARATQPATRSARTMLNRNPSFFPDSRNSQQQQQRPDVLVAAAPKARGLNTNAKEDEPTDPIDEAPYDDDDDDTDDGHGIGVADDDSASDGGAIMGDADSGGEYNLVREVGEEDVADGDSDFDEDLARVMETSVEEDNLRHAHAMLARRPLPER